MGKNEKPNTAITLSIIAGVLILISATQSLMFSVTGEFSKWPGIIGHGWMGMMMHGWTGFGTVFGIVGVVIGIIVILSALMLNSRPKKHVRTVRLSPAHSLFV